MADPTGVATVSGSNLNALRMMAPKVVIGLSQFLCGRSGHIDPAIVAEFPRPSVTATARDVRAAMRGTSTAFTMEARLLAGREI